MFSEAIFPANFSCKLTNSSHLPTSNCLYRCLIRSTPSCCILRRPRKEQNTKIRSTHPPHQRKLRVREPVHAVRTGTRGPGHRVPRPTVSLETSALSNTAPYAYMYAYVSAYILHLNHQLGASYWACLLYAPKASVKMHFSKAISRAFLLDDQSTYSSTA